MKAILGVLGTVSVVLFLGTLLVTQVSSCNQQIYNEGVEAGKYGIPIEECPYNPRPGGETWRRGHLAGRIQAIKESKEKK